MWEPGTHHGHYMTLGLAMKGAPARVHSLKLCGKPGLHISGFCACKVLGLWFVVHKVPGLALSHLPGPLIWGLLPGAPQSRI